MGNIMEFSKWEAMSVRPTAMEIMYGHRQGLHGGISLPLAEIGGRGNASPGEKIVKGGTRVGTIQSIGAVIVACAVIAAVTVLTWHGSINGEAAVGILATIIGGGGVATVAHVATKTGASASYVATERALKRD